jgi:cohesin loading factor subunit SCC2
MADSQEARVCSEAIDSSFSSAKMVATYLVQRSGTTKANKMAVDTDYKAVLETLIADLLTVLYRPEWPAASLFLNVISRLMVRDFFPAYTTSPTDG